MWQLFFGSCMHVFCACFSCMFFATCTLHACQNLKKNSSVATSSDRYQLALFSTYYMALVLVKWLEEDRVSTLGTTTQPYTKNWFLLLEEEVQYVALIPKYQVLQLVSQVLLSTDVIAELDKKRSHQQMYGREKEAKIKYVPKVLCNKLIVLL